MKICVKKTNQEFVVPEAVAKHFPQNEILTINTATPLTINFIFDALTQDDLPAYINEKGPKELINIADAIYTANHFKLTDFVKALQPSLEKSLRHQNVGDANKQLRFSSSFYADEQNFLHRDFKATFNE